MESLTDLSTGDMLKEVNKAIFAIMVAGQEYKIGSFYLKRADLSMLRRIKSELESQIASENGNGLLDNTYVAVFDGR